MNGETQQASAPVELDLTTITPIDSGKPVNAASNLRQSVSYGVQQNPDDYAKLLKQQQVTGMTPQAAAPFAGETQNAIDVESLNPEKMVDSHPRTAAWAANPDNAAVSGADELHRLTRIEQHAATMRAYEPTWRDKASDAAQSAFESLGGSGSLKQRVFQYPLVRLGVGALRGTEEMLGNTASFAGIHGDNPEGLNALQRSARTLEPVQFGEEETGLDKLAGNIGPMVPALMASGGTSLIARTLGLSDKAAKVLAGLSVGGMFTADQGGRTYSAMKEQGASEYDARLAANRVAGINAPANALFGATEVVPFMRDNPLLSSLGLGAVTGVSGQVAQNVVTGRPKSESLAKAALEGAAVQGGMHFGMTFMESMSEAVAEVEQSKLRTRSAEKFQEAMEAHFEGDSSLRIPAQDFVNYFVDKDIDPSVAAHRMGVANLTEAAAAGTDLEIPKANFFGKLEPEHQKGLLPDIIDPATEITGRQAEAGRQELKDWVAGGGAEKLHADFAAADAETQATPEWQKVFGELKQRYQDAGETDQAADSYATLQANAISNLAKRAGLKPDELLALHNPQIIKGDTRDGLTLNQELHYADVESPEFKQWFGQSKMVDDDGMPLVAYHGTAHDFDSFDISKAGAMSGSEAQGALFFSSDPEVASKYADVANATGTAGGDRGGQVYPVYLRLENPYRSKLKFYNTGDFEREIAKAKKKGHDGIVFPNVKHAGESGQIAVFSPEQVKSVFNRGTFDASDRILYQGAGEDKSPERHLVHNNWGEAGRKFTATWPQTEQLQPGDIVAENKDKRALKVLSIGEKTATGGQWYNFEVVDADAARAAGEAIRPNVKKQPLSLRDDVEVKTFKTAKGSTYEVHEDGATTRNKSFHPEHGEADQGPQPRSEQTFYVTPQDAQKLGEFQTRGARKAIVFDGENAGVKYLEGKSSGKVEKRTWVSAETEPKMGMIPVELWNGGEKAHFGNEISEINGATPQPQSRAEESRGWFRVLPDGRYEIGKTKLGDMSTFIHEPAHAYLELFRELTQREGASDPLKDDFKKITDWLGTTPDEAYKNGFTREQHERWARANEEYVREGKAPTSGLQRAFHNFATWLTSIYRRAGALGVEMSSEIRGVMDRLYAGDSAVDRAEQEAGREQLFESPEEAGWTEEEFRNYARGRGVEEAEARKLILGEMKEAAQRERTHAWREEKGGVRDAVTDQVDAQPEYRAIRSLRRGRLDDGTEISVNRDLLIKQFGEERVKALQDLHRGLYRAEGGTDAETAAELLGFGSGEEMMRALEKAPRRAQAIEAAVRDTMTARHGDIRYDGSLDDKARLAVENSERAKNLHKELAALRRKVASLEKKAADAKAAMRSITIEPLEHYQEAARQMIDQKSIADLQPHRYLNASRKFSREAFDSLRKGNVRGAADAKNKELLNHFLFREASAARDYAEKFESYAKRMQSRGIQQRLGLAGSDYREQFNWLMARYRLGPAPQAPERSLREWADQVYGQGSEPAIAAGILNEGKFADYRNVPLSEVRDLHDALVNIRHLAMQEFKMYVQGKQVAFAEAKQEMIASARDNLKSKPEQIFQENLSRGEKVLRGLAWVDSRLIRMERLVEWLDGGKAGPWHDNLWNLASDAQGDEYKLQEDVTRKVTDALADMPAEMRRRLWTEKVSVEGISEPLTRRRLLSMAFNMGNEGNLDRLRKTFDSFGWDRGAIEKIGGMLTREEWGFVQKAWDSLKPMGERMVELEKRLTGLPPAMVKVTPFKVVRPEGNEEIELEGGYFPIVMDPRFSERAIQQDAKESAQNAMQSGYVRATTSKGYTKERTGFGGPLLLDYEQVLTSHVAKVAKDLSHREFMLASQRLLLDTEVRKTLRETLGPAYEQQFMPWLRTIINDNNGSVQERLDGLKDGMQKLRGNIVAASLGFNTSTSLLQVSHAPRMLLYAKTSSLAQAFVDLLAHPIETSQEVRDLSPNEMRFRGDNLDRDIRAVLQNPSYQAGYTRKVAVAARFALEVMDHLLSHTLWKAAYRDALDRYAELPIGEAQQKAAHEADSAVRLGLGTSAPKDLPAIMRSNEFNKFITTLYGFHNGVYNQLRDIGHQVRYDKNIGKATVASILTVVAPAVLGSWLTGRGPKDDESPGAWAAKKALLFATDTVPILRSITSALEGGHDVQFSPVENTMEKGAKAVMAAMPSDKEKDWMGIALNAGDAAGAILGVPGSHQAVKTLRYIKRANEGKVENPNIWNALVGGGR